MLDAARRLTLETSLTDAPFAALRAKLEVGLIFRLNVDLQAGWHADDAGVNADYDQQFDQVRLAQTVFPCHR